MPDPGVIPSGYRPDALFTSFHKRAFLRRAKDPMYLKTHTSPSDAHPFPLPFKLKTKKPDGTLSQQDLQRIVAEILG